MIFISFLIKESTKPSSKEVKDIKEWIIFTMSLYRYRRNNKQVC